MPIRSKRLSLFKKRLPKTGFPNTVRDYKMFWFHCWETLAEIGSARFLEAARLVFPGHLHELADSKDGGAAWQGLGCALQDHGNVGSWVLGELKKKATFWRAYLKVPTLLWNSNSAWWFPPFGGVGWLQPNTCKSIQISLGSSICKDCVVEFKIRKIGRAKSQVPKVVAFFASCKKDFSAWNKFCKISGKMLEKSATLQGSGQKNPQHWLNSGKKTATLQGSGQKNPQHWLNLGKKPQHFREVARKNRNIGWTWKKKPQHFREVARKNRNVGWTWEKNRNTSGKWLEKTATLGWTWKKPQQFREVARKTATFVELEKCNTSGMWLEKPATFVELGKHHNTLGGPEKKRNTSGKWLEPFETLMLNFQRKNC